MPRIQARRPEDTPENADRSVRSANPWVAGIAALLLAASSLLIHLFFFLPQGLMVLIVELGIVLAASRYGFKVMALGAGTAKAAKALRRG